VPLEGRAGVDGGVREGVGSGALGVEVGGVDSAGSTLGSAISCCGGDDGGWEGCDEVCAPCPQPEINDSRRMLTINN